VARTAYLERLDTAQNAVSPVAAGPSIFLHMDDEDSEPYFAFHAKDGSVKPSGNFKPQVVEYADGVACWGGVDYREAMMALAEAQNMEIDRVGALFGEIRMPVKGEDVISDWNYHPWLGVYRDIH
jgi:CRISPR-associated endonuclease/helicase Cas3